MTFVLVHGGGFAASCWERLPAHLDAPCLAVDLPGRGSHPADLEAVTVADFVDAVVGEIEQSDLRDVTLVGHSLAGITLPGVLERIPGRIRRAVFLSASVPADGQRVFDLLDPDIQRMAQAEEGARHGEVGPLDPEVATAMFCNDMDTEQARFTIERMVPESPRLIFEHIGHRGLREPIPRTYVRLGQDLALSPAKQDQIIENMGGADVVDLDAGHMAMISRPKELADILNVAA